MNHRLCKVRLNTTSSKVPSCSNTYPTARLTSIVLSLSSMITSKAYHSGYLYNCKVNHTATDNPGWPLSSSAITYQGTHATALLIIIHEMMLSKSYALTSANCWCLGTSLSLPTVPRTEIRMHQTDSSSNCGQHDEETMTLSASRSRFQIHSSSKGVFRLLSVMSYRSLTQALCS